MFAVLIIFVSILEPNYSLTATLCKEPLILRASATRRDQVDVWLAQLRSTHSGKQKTAKRKLISLARASEDHRTRIVRNLINFLNKPSLKIKLLNRQDFQTFTIVSEILGELKAVEALDALVACLNCSNGVYGQSASRHPATIAVAQMGEAAIPHLTNALQHDDWVGVKVLAARTLGMIGGEKAKKVLQDALVTEKDDEVIGAIRRALHAI